VLIPCDKIDFIQQSIVVVTGACNTECVSDALGKTVAVNFCTDILSSVELVPVRFIVEFDMR